MLVIIGLYQEEKNKLLNRYFKRERNFNIIECSFLNSHLRKVREKANNFKQKLFLFFSSLSLISSLLSPDFPSSLLLLLQSTDMKCSLLGAICRDTRDNNIYVYFFFLGIYLLVVSKLGCMMFTIYLTYRVFKPCEAMTACCRAAAGMSFCSGCVCVCVCVQFSTASTPSI